LIICLVFCAVAWPRRRQREGAFALGTCGSAAIYVLTFLFVGVASDFRYAYWAVLAALTGGAVVVSCRVEPDPGRIESRRWWPIAARGRRINPERTHSSWVASVRS
jgi:peptidoglycan/LPS O-acetylase OafA/YrhL